ncbi:sporulation protein YqfD [Psychrobacillus sp.]|uniref:sporulation protein YqfD n=1 Tax=Psychrobacillus sp. TaxID=1871623 RepID=UPI0028BE4D24|nr:sporulation protein YqfD [Psychrobacillus sp.]
MQQSIRVRVPIKTDQQLLFQRLRAVNIIAYEVRSSADYLYFSIRKKDLPAFRKVRRTMKFSVQLVDETKKGIIDIYSFAFIGVLLFVCIPVVLSQFIWSVQIEADSPESNVLITEQLKEMGIHPTIRSSTLPTEQEIRQNLLAEHKKYSWIHFTESGSKFTVTPMLAPIQSGTVVKKAPPTHLIAKRSGVVTDFQLTKGVRAVEKNISVKKGDILVNGFVTQGDKRIITSAEGKVYANYWVELEFELPTQLKITQPNERKLIIQRKKEKPLHFWKEITLPKFLSSYVEAGYVQTVEEKTYQLDEKSMQTLLLPLLYQKITKDLPADTQILEDKVLHVTVQNDKVRGKVLFLINENIAVQQVIPQGDEA